MPKNKAKKQTPDLEDLFEQLRSYLQEPEVDDAHYNLRVVHEMLGLDLPDYLEE